jgi:hypothetical protein
MFSRQNRLVETPSDLAEDISPPKTRFRLTVKLCLRLAALRFLAGQGLRDK